MTVKEVPSEKLSFFRKPFLLALDRRKPDCEYFELALTLKNGLDDMSKVILELAKKKIRILSGVHMVREDNFFWFLFIEVPKSVSIDNVSESLLKIDPVLDIKWERISESDFFDKFLFPPHFYDDRVILFTANIFHEIVKEVTDLITGAGEEILFYREGVTAGSKLYDMFPERLTSVEEKLAFMKDILRIFGWGIVKLSEIDLEAKTGLIKVYKSLEATSPVKVKCNFLRGIITGMLRKIFNDPSIEVEEIKCVSMGNTHCEFKFKLE